MKYSASKRDFYWKKAKEESYPSRAVFKLKEINDKYKLFKRGDKVLDLGSSPGSWLMYIAKEIGPKGKAVGLDIENLKIGIGENVLFFKKDVFKDEIFSCQALKDKFDSVVSDLAPKTSGIKFTDSEKSLELSQKALEIAKAVLKEKGNFLCKIFEGEETQNFLKEIKKNFEFIKKFRPKATPRGSKEIYIIAKNFLS